MSEVILIIVLAWPGTVNYEKEFVFPTMDHCLQVLKATKIVIPNGNSENEWAGFKTCKYK